MQQHRLSSLNSETCCNKPTNFDLPQREYSLLLLLSNKIFENLCCIVGRLQGTGAGALKQYVDLDKSKILKFRSISIIKTEFEVKVIKLLSSNAQLTRSVQVNVD